MSRTWLQFLLIAFDDFGAVVLFNRPGITISSLCSIAMAGQDAPLKLWAWQRSLLLWLGARLGHAHCDAAALADIERARAVIGYLTSTW
jgi:hypothetical protein